MMKSTFSIEKGAGLPIRVASLIAITLLVMAISNSGNAQTLNWINNTNSSSYFDADWNWSPSAVPGPASRVVFGVAGTYDVWWDQVTANVVPTVSDLRVTQGRVRFRNVEPTSQWELRLNGSGAATPLQVSGSGTRLTLEGVRLRSQGPASITSGAELRVDGNHAMGARLVVDGTLSVNGILDARNGARMDVLGANLATSAFDSRADVFISGSGTLWNIQNDLTIGGNQDATLNLSGGARINSRHGIIASGLSSFSNAIVSGNGTQWVNSGNLTIGRDGDGFLWINGGLVSNVNGAIGDGIGTGRVDVIGSTSRWNNSGSLDVYGTMNIGSGGIVTSSSGKVARQFLSTTPTSVLIEGVGSRWSNAGNLTITDRLDIRSGGEVASFHATINTPSTTTSHAGQVAISGAGSRMTLTGALSIHGGTLDVSNGGSVTSGSTRLERERLAIQAKAVIAGSGSSMHTFGNLRVGEIWQGELEISGGAYVHNVSAFVASELESATVRVEGLGTHWNSLLDIQVGINGQVFISDQALVTVGRHVQVAFDGGLQLNGGVLSFGSMSEASLRRIHANSGLMLGAVTNFGMVDVATLAPLQQLTVDTSNVSLVNSGVLNGNSSHLGSGLVNTESGRVDVGTALVMNFMGNINQNRGLVENLGGRLGFGRALINESSGIIRGYGEFEAVEGWTNRGLMEFRTGTSDIYGDVLNESGRIHVIDNGLAVFYGDVVHNATEFFVESGSTVLFAGLLGGTGTITGEGSIQVAGELGPGNSAGTLEIAGDLWLLGSATTLIELGGLNTNEFDRLLINGDLNIAGSLQVSLIDGHLLGNNEQYLIASVGGNRNGFWNGFGEGALVGNFGGRDLFITYGANNGAGIALFTAVPEPSSLLLLAACFAKVVVTRRRR
ncbi:MAG TPA: hypothetical protein PKD64_16720 [Pirellulaceae bacterium]|nr:hypothetical protein [Pirellulaceae bacterium]HMO93831.1 hypothetical protein [Pirellulaceae bacterium]HMP71368.1 hypothetical protein [Pirellulaceae bacterium]